MTNAYKDVALYCCHVWRQEEITQTKPVFMVTGRALAATHTSAQKSGIIRLFNTNNTKPLGKCFPPFFCHGTHPELKKSQGTHLQNLSLPW